MVVNKQGGTGLVVEREVQLAAANIRAELLVEELVEQKVAEAMGASEAIFEPFFQPKRIITAIRRLQTVDEREKFTHYFNDWGCLVCEKKGVFHAGLGMCKTCYRNRAARMRATLRKHAAPRDDQPVFVDSVKLAREALEPSLMVLGGRGPGGAESVRQPEPDAPLATLEADTGSAK